MFVEIKCRKCKAQFTVSDNGDGSRVMCTLCRTPIDMPRVVPANTNERSERIHPLVWAAIGGGSIAVLALIVGLLLVPGGQPNPDEHNQVATAPNDSKATATPAIGDLKPADKWWERMSDPVVEHERGEPTAELPQPPEKLQGASPRREEKPPGHISKRAPAVLSAEDLYDQISPSVVTIKVKDEDGEEIATGSGFFLDGSLFEGQYKRLLVDKSFAEFRSKNGTPSQPCYVVTNSHVLRPAVAADIVLHNGEKGPAWRVIAEDEIADLALLFATVPLNQPVKGLTLARDDPRVLATVFAIGSPKGLSGSASEGKVSGYREFLRGRWLQTTAAISPGSSGGPLLLGDGTLVGVTTLARSDAQNINFAVPVSKVRDFLSSEFRQRGIAEGASIVSHAEDAFSDAIPIRGETEREPGKQQLANAWRALKESNYEQAIAVAEQAEKSLPEEFKFLTAYLIGKASNRLAVDAAQKTAFRTVDEFQTRYKLSDHAKAAERELARAIRLKPGFSPTFESLFWHYQSCGDWPNALIASDSLVKLMPRCAEALGYRARSYYKLQQSESAKTDLHAAIKLSPRKGKLYYDLAGALIDLREYADAIAVLEMALELEYHPFMVWHSIGVAHKKAGEFTKAIQAFEKAKALGSPANWCDAEIAMCKRGER